MCLIISMYKIDISHHKVELQMSGKLLRKVERVIKKFHLILRKAKSERQSHLRYIRLTVIQI